jgi:hypothetical protein
MASSYAARHAVARIPRELSTTSSPSSSSSSHGRGVVKTTADVRRRWQSRKSLRMPLADEHREHTFASYISDGERIINVTFPDAKRRQKLDDVTWRVQLLPFEFLGAKVTVYSTLTLTPKPEGLYIGCKRLEFVGMPREMDLDNKVVLTMEGALRPPRNGRVNGDVTLTLDAEVNEFVAMNPGLDIVVNGINDTVLSNLQGSIERSLLRDYARWSRAEAARSTVPASDARAL